MVILLVTLLAAAAEMAMNPDQRWRPDPAAVKVAPAKSVPSDIHNAGPASPKRQSRPIRAQVLAAVKDEWARYDRGAKGRLTPLEFSTWVIRANGASVAQSGSKKSSGIKPIPAMNATSTAFARADADHDGSITQEEMTSFLMVPPRPTALQTLKTDVKPAAGGNIAAGRAAR